MPRARAFVFSMLAPFAIVAACGGDDNLFSTTPDGGADATADTTLPVDGNTGNPDTGVDANLPDTFVADTGLDAPADRNVPPDTGVDAGVDSGVDAGIDSGVDAGVDSGVDAGVDSGGTISDASIDVQVFDGGACNTLVNGGPSVPETRVPQDVPVAQGGTIAMGLYYLTSWQVFTGVGGASGPTGNTRKTAFYFYPTTYLKVTADNGLSDEHDNRTWSIIGNRNETLKSDQYCPQNDMLTSDFTVIGNQLILIAGQNVLTFTHQ